MEIRKSQAQSLAVKKPTSKTPAVQTRAQRPPLGPGRDRLTLSERAQASRPAIDPLPAVAPPPPPPPPPVPVAESLPRAIEMALKGEAVRTPGGKPLSIQSSPLEEGLTRYQIGLGAHQVTVEAAAPQDLAVGVEYFEQVPDHLKPSLLALTLDEMASNTFKVRIKTLEGREEPLTVKRTSTEQGVNAYEIASRAATFKLSTPKDDDLFKGLSETLNLYTQVPEHLRSSLKTLHIDKGASPTDEAFAKQYNMPDFKSAATAGNGGISFWHGTQYVQDAIFHHEFGHVIGQRYSTDGRNLYPDGWEEAIAKDGKQVTDYAKVNPTEDFAETWWIFVTLKQGRKVDNQPPTLDEFKAQYPHRAAVLEGIYANTLKPLN